MMVRVLTAQVPAAHVGTFNAVLRRKLEVLRDQPGLVYAKLARRLDDRGGEEVMLFEEWRSPSDLWAWTGGALNEPQLLPGTEAMTTALRIDHFELLDVDLDASMAGLQDGQTA